MRRYPLEPLLAHIRPVLDPVTPVHDQQPVRVLAGIVGRSERSLYRWRENGGMPEQFADRAACALGLHPLLIWSEYAITIEEDAA